MSLPSPAATELRQYLSHLATEDQVAASTQNVALSALLFLYREVLLIDLPLIEGVERAKRPQRIPVVLTPEEVKRVLAQMTGTHHLMASLLYGVGLRLMECVRREGPAHDIARTHCSTAPGET